MPFDAMGRWTPNQTLTSPNPTSNPNGPTPSDWSQYAPTPQQQGPQYMQQQQSVQPVPQNAPQSNQMAMQPQIYQMPNQSVTQQVQSNPQALQNFLQQGNQRGAGANNTQFNSLGQQGAQAQGGFTGFQTNGSQPSMNQGYNGSTAQNSAGLAYAGNGSQFGTSQSGGSVGGLSNVSNPSQGITLAANQYLQPNNMFYNNPLKTPLSPTQQMQDNTPRQMPTRDTSSTVPIGTNNVTTSDKRSKTNIKEESKEGDLQEFLDALGVYSYEYKEPNLPGAGHGTHFGPMAQEIESSKLGKPAIKTNPETGYKQVDTAKLSMVQLGATAMLNNRVKELEKKLSQMVKQNMKNKGKK